MNNIKTTIEKHLDTFQKDVKNYLNYINEYMLKFDIIGTSEEQIEKYETVIDRVRDIIQQKKIIRQTTENILNEIESVFKSSNEINEPIEVLNDKIIRKLLSLEDERHTKRIKELNEYLISPINKEIEEVLDYEEMNKLEEWTKMRCNKVIFDSNKDNWSVNYSVFDDKISGRNDLMFIIEDVNDNKFGGYVYSLISNTNQYIKDSKSFLFSLKSNRRINAMQKFEIKSNAQSYAFYMNKKSDNGLLFYLGYGSIIINKENDKLNSSCYQNNDYFDYHGTSEAFLPNCKPGSGNIYFRPKRFIVIQMK